ncbi:uncharacterized protein N7482_005063 [Penicillium canariense]|uniref:Uncharacterized protein n=1 Tax=Penicillium canariense TaxID=189055 RepID=A0A9W9I5W7_9EURO|nr:uncharacterized protein N7482_005063 [Penicillium canariense]KAJ5166282.1 hypothetical protein N7482_005063 [Penicillium canariense]
MPQYALPGANQPHKTHPTGPSLKPRHGRWYIPVVAAIGLGFAGYNYYQEARSRREFAMAEEEKRLARNQQLMDAYGNKDSIHDVQHALDTYRAR